MITLQLLDYVKQLKLQGRDDAFIKSYLLQNNWSQADIDQAFLQQNTIPITTVSSETLSEHAKSSKMPVFIGLIFVFLLIVGGVGGYLYLSKTSSKEANVNTAKASLSPVPTTATDAMKVYTPRDGIFSFEYPASWKYEEKVDEQSLIPNGKKYQITTVTFNKIVPTMSPGESISDYTQKNPNPDLLYFTYTSSPDFVNLNIADFYRNNSIDQFKYISSKEVEINKDLKVTELHYRCFNGPNEKNECALILFVHKDMLIGFNSGFGDLKDLDDLYKIVKTFKSTE